MCSLGEGGGDGAGDQALCIRYLFLADMMWIKHEIFRAECQEVPAEDMFSSDLKSNNIW